MQGFDSGFNHLYNSLQNMVTMKDRPLLAHYTSLEVLEKIFLTNEIWFSNPLFMNDLQEMRFGILEGVKTLNEFALEQQFIDICGSRERAEIIQNSFLRYFQDFDAKHVLDVYVFCLSEHEPTNTDGLLSMWRGYGGNGAGAALVFKTDAVTLNASSPLLFAKVQYASEQERVAWMKTIFSGCAAVLKQEAIPDDKLYHVAFHMFSLVKLYALTSKHHGFKEEREWRIIYLPDRDPNRLLAEQFSYVVGKNGIEPKLRLRIEPLKTDPRETWTFHSILDRIILGPNISSPLSISAVRRMFETLKRPEFTEMLTSSSIPLRPNQRLG